MRPKKQTFLSRGSHRSWVASSPYASNPTECTGKVVDAAREITTQAQARALNYCTFRLLLALSKRYKRGPKGSFGGIVRQAYRIRRTRTMAKGSVVNIYERHPTLSATSRTSQSAAGFLACLELDFAAKCTEHRHCQKTCLSGITA